MGAAEARLFAKEVLQSLSPTCSKKKATPSPLPAVTSSIALANLDTNGATLGIAAWILSYAVESAVSAWRLRRLGWYVER
jgi:hypothetical protein